jgi:hypothetical protein
MNVTVYVSMRPTCPPARREVSSTRTSLRKSNAATPLEIVNVEAHESTVEPADYAKPTSLFVNRK